MTLSLLDEPGAEPAPARNSNVAEYSVSELSAALRRAVEDGFARVRVRGEIGGFKGRHASGHCYFTLKDADACIEAVVWRTSYARLAAKPEDGLEVIATGRLTTFQKSSKYQIVIEELELAGLGALLKQLEERRRKLAAEGLFDAARKRPLPLVPGVIGVITAPGGAVIRDILHRVADRWPSRVIVWPVRVQGDTCAAEVTAALRGFANWDGPRPDVIIVARGGGSIEDLWGFNDEALVRAVAASPIPVISAVGHETDWTLIDHVADFRAPTPTGAAERVVPVRSECMATLGQRARRLEIAIAGRLDERRGRLRLLARTLPAGEDVLAPARQRLDLAADRLAGALYKATAEARQRFLGSAGRLTHAVARRAVERAGAQRLAGGRSFARAVAGVLTDRRAVLARVGAGLTPRLLERTLAEKAREMWSLAQRRDAAVAALIAARQARWAGSRLSPALLARPVAAARDRLDGLSRREERAADALIAAASARCGGVRLAPHLLARPVAEARGRLGAAERRVERSFAARLGAARTRHGAAAKLLGAVSYRSVLARGYAVVRRPPGVPLHGAAEVESGEALELEFHDGRVNVVETSGGARAALVALRPVRRARKVADDAQGLLL